MAISITSLGTTSGASGATLALGGCTVPVGALIVVCVDENANTASRGTVADDAGNTYTRAIAGNNNAGNANGYGALYYAYNAAALSAQNITFTRVTSGSSIGCQFGIDVQAA